MKQCGDSFPLQRALLQHQSNLMMGQHQRLQQQQTRAQINNNKNVLDDTLNGLQGGPT